MRKLWFLAFFLVSGCARDSRIYSDIREWISEFPGLSAMRANDPIVATVGPVTVRASDLKRWLARTYSPTAPMGAGRADRRRELDELIRHAMLVRIAAHSALAHDPDYQIRLKAMKEELLVTMF